MKHARPDYDRIQDPAGLIPADEPVFLIRGQDVAAIKALLAYTEEAKRVGADPNMIALVRGQIDAIYRWQAEKGAKVPDLPSIDETTADELS